MADWTKIVAGAGIGTLFGGPAGAAVGAAVGYIFGGDSSTLEPLPQEVTPIPGDGSLNDPNAAAVPDVPFTDGGTYDPNAGLQYQLDAAAATLAAHKRFLTSPTPDEAQQIVDACLSYLTKLGAAAAFGPLLAGGGTLASMGSAVASAGPMAAGFAAVYGPAFLATLLPGSPMTAQDMVNLFPVNVVNGVSKAVIDSVNKVFFGASAADAQAASWKTVLAQYGVTPEQIDAVMSGNASEETVIAVANGVQQNRRAVGSGGKMIYDANSPGGSRYVGPSWGNQAGLGVDNPAPEDPYDPLYYNQGGGGRFGP
jgi:hypothetical protein